MEIELRKFDVVNYLKTPEDMAAYLDAAIEDAGGDVTFIAKALGDIARAQGMTKVSSASGLARESLYKALSGDRVPSFETILKVMQALGLSFNVNVADKLESNDPV